MAEHVHWKKLYNPNYFGCYCFEDERDLIVTIKDVVKENVTSEGGKQEQCTVMYFEEAVKPLICNKTNAKIIQKIYGTAFIDEWVNRKIQLYPDRNVRFGKDIVEGVRVRPFIPQVDVPKTQELVCAKCKKAIEDSGKFTAATIAKTAMKKHGMMLCMGCGIEENAAKEVAVE